MVGALDCIKPIDFQLSFSQINTIFDFFARCFEAILVKFDAKSKLVQK